MAVSLKHAFTSNVADSGDTTLVQPSNWNAEHTLTMSTGFVLGRTTAGTGAVEEIAPVPVALGGTGATTLTGLIKGSGTSAFTAATAGTDYMAPSTTSTVTVGFTFTPFSLGTVTSGTTTLSAANGNYQSIINGGAFSLSPPATGTYDAIDLLVINGPSAGAITFTAGRWRVGLSTGSTFATAVRASGTATISNANPAVVTRSSHGCVDGDPVYLTTSGALPTGLSANTVYYVKYVSTSTFQLAATPGGTSIATSSAGSGTHTLNSCSQFVLSIRQIYGSATYSWYAMQ